MADKPPQEAADGASDEPSEKVGPGKPPRHTRLQIRPVRKPEWSPQGLEELRHDTAATTDEEDHHHRGWQAEALLTVQEVIARRLATDSMKGATKAMELLIRLTSTKSDEGAGKDVASETVLPDKEALRRIHKRITKLVGEE